MKRAERAGQSLQAQRQGAGRRFAKAAALIAAFALACCAVDAVLDAACPGVFPSAVQEVLGMPAAAAAPDGAAAQEALPEGFAQEVVDLSDARDVRVGAGGAVVGFVRQGSAAQAFDDLEARLAANGWEPVDSGRADCGTFVKEEGRYTWLFAGCTQVGESVSTVLQLPAAAQAGTHG